VDELRRGDVVFTDLEVAIRTPESGAPTRSDHFLHVAERKVLDCLAQMGFSLLALANNHAWDLDTAGILATRRAVAKHGFGHAGSGRDLREASSFGSDPIYPEVKLVAMASGKIRPGAAATPTRAGVNELRIEPQGKVNSVDVVRILETISSAASEKSLVIAYLHNHEWGEDMRRVKRWEREFAYHCIDAGASIFVSHGAPVLRAIECYRSRPILHGLGSLVFHTRTEVGHYPPEVWQSAIVHAKFDNTFFRGMEIIPVQLNERSDDPQHPHATRGRPRLAYGSVATEILKRLGEESIRTGTVIDIREDRAFVWCS